MPPSQNADEKMLCVTTDAVSGFRIAEVFGMVRGAAVNATTLGDSFAAGLRAFSGGVVTQYEDLLDETRTLAMRKMAYEAKTVGADAVVGVRISTNMIHPGVAEVLAYGTAVRLEPE